MWISVGGATDVAAPVVRCAVVVFDLPVGTDEGAAGDVGRPAVPAAMRLPYQDGAYHPARDGQDDYDTDAQPEAAHGGSLDGPARDSRSPGSSHWAPIAPLSGWAPLTIACASSPSRPSLRPGRATRRTGPRPRS